MAVRRRLTLVIIVLAATLLHIGSLLPVLGGQWPIVCWQLIVVHTFLTRHLVDALIDHGLRVLVNQTRNYDQ